MLVIHNRTVLTTEFIYIDETTGAVVKRENGQQVIEQLSQDEFVKAYEQLVEFKASREAECQVQSE